ncbi:Arylsulfatase A [Microlunatus soli]|uniref:Arylsulfatase A n=2 Tax=Microlunatus soli TaxID=630515 RepID=A0A1H1TCL0_9ACTN|nr:Arylsulfatase A [Microlunatus soli]
MPATPTLMSLLTDAGYRTHGVGKMHFTPDTADLRGFQTRDSEEEFGDCESDDYLRWLSAAGHDAVQFPHGMRDEMYYIPQLSPLPEEAHPTRWVAERSRDFLAERRSPFFLWSSFIAPHPPFSPPAPWHRRYPASLLPEPHRPAGGGSLLTSYNRLQNRYKFRDGGRDRRLEQLIRSYYYASITFADHEIGRIVAALADSGRLDDTMIILTADHGEFLGDYGCYGKRSFLDPAARVPLICSGPGFGRGQRIGSPVSLVDILPTAIRAAGAELPDTDGLPLQTPAADRTLYGQYQQGTLGLYSVINQRWKYIWSAPDHREYLIDRRHDPLETMNLAYNIRAREQLLALRRQATAHFQELDLERVAADSHNHPVRIGAAPSEGGGDAFAGLDIDPDAATLIVQD